MGAPGRVFAAGAAGWWLSRGAPVGTRWAPCMCERIFIERDVPTEPAPPPPGIFSYPKQDIVAGIVVFLVALPLCLGIAVACKLPPLSGLVAGIIGGVGVAAISRSPLSVSGPAAGLTAIVAGAIGKLPAWEAFLLAVVLAGMLQLLFGFLKGGFLGDYVPNSVIKGMLAAIGIILILKQFPHIIGFDNDFSGDEAFFQKEGNDFLSGS